MVAEQVVALDLLVDVVVAVGPLVHEGEDCGNPVVLNYILVKALYAAKEKIA